VGSLVVVVVGLGVGDSVGKINVYTSVFPAKHDSPKQVHVHSALYGDFCKSLVGRLLHSLHREGGTSVLLSPDPALSNV